MELITPQRVSCSERARAVTRVQQVSQKTAADVSRLEIRRASYGSCARRRTTIEWAESHNFPPFSQAKMEDTRFVDLKVKVGFPYLYCHQGDCEHLVIITDIRSKPVLCLQSVPTHASELVFCLIVSRLKYSI